MTSIGDILKHFNKLLLRFTWLLRDVHGVHIISGHMQEVCSINVLEHEGMHM